MIISFSFSFFFFFYISFASSSSFNATHKCSPQQSLDLLLFKENMSFINNSGDYVMDSDCKGWLGSGYHPITMNWNKNTDCCKWSGITCNHLTGDVIGIDLSCGMLQGTIHPNTTIFHLPHLQTLNLAFNNFFHSQLPREIGGLSKSLTLLNLSDCGFTGDTPEEILYLPKLVSLDLSWNDGLQIQPSVLKNLLLNSTHLKELLLKEVDISWVLPRYLNISTSLKSLDLRSTNLQGKFPDNIFSLQYLEKLLLSFNYDLTGPLPTVNTTTNIPLKWLGLSGTNLSGEIPESVGHLKSLTTLGLSNCGLVGSIPKSLVNLRQLTTLYLSSNKLNGTLPSFVFTLPFIEILNLANNNFTGLWDLNTLFSSLPNLQTLDLSYSGLIVVSNNNTKYVNPEFRDLRLASCNLTVFPESLRAMKKLKYLDLSSNHIHGHIPDWAPEIGGNGLRILILSYNFITSLPAQFQWDGLEGLHVQTNQIQGPFPQSICGLSSLLRLDISNNSFDGVIPQCLGNISSSLTRLAVKLNKLQGPFPSLLCNMSLLITLDMSGNNFRGEIPQCFGNISSSLRMVDMGNNDFHGTIPNMYECGQLQGLIMKGNQLQGEIPSSLSKCRSFLILDLGNNQLNGTFPHWLGDLPYLQVLVLKSNKLHGPIQTPSTTQNAFPSIRVLILSHNKFVGLLPRTYLQNVSVMKNKTRKSTIPSYLNMGGKYYSITTAVKGAVLEFPKISVNYLILDLSNNKFEGEIPNVIGSLTSLIVLDLSHNNLTGQIPPVLGNLSEIESLDLSWNQLTGEIPQALAGLKFLGFLNLSQNHLKGRIPSGGQFNTFGTSFEGNPKLCGLPLPKLCGLPHEPQHELDGDGDGDWESGFTWKMVMLGYGCGTLPGLLIGYFMLSTGRPKWLNALVLEAEHIIHTMKTRRRRRYIFIGK